MSIIWGILKRVDSKYFIFFVFSLGQYCTFRVTRLADRFFLPQLTAKYCMVGGARERGEMAGNGCKREERVMGE